MAAIRITSSNTTTGDLTLIDSRGNSATNFNAHRGDLISWEIQPNSGVSALSGFAQKNVPNNQNVFSEFPAKLGNSSNWQGKVNPNLNSAGTFQDSYEINWQDPQGNSYTYDPVIQINPL